MPERARVKGGVVGWGVGGGRRGRMCERMRVVVGGEGSMVEGGGGLNPAGEVGRVGGGNERGGWYRAILRCFIKLGHSMSQLEGGSLRSPGSVEEPFYSSLTPQAAKWVIR